MSTRHFKFVGIFLFSFISCGGGSSIELDVVLASNDTINPLIQISADMSTGASTGVYFVLDELKPTPVSINDTLAGGTQYSEPNLSNGQGADPLKDQFKISTGSLQASSFYRVKMIARDATGNVTHTGTGDCPVKIAFEEQNLVKICFGKNDLSDPPLCPGLTAFTSCPGL